jgi:acyl-CoA thioester hydrolase
VLRENYRFFHPFRVRYSEIDGQKVVFNAHYLTYFDTAITEYFRWLPFDYVKHYEETGLDFHTARSLVEYKAPIGYDEEIDVYVRVARLGRSSLSFDIGIYARGEEQPRATGEVVWVQIDQQSGKSTPVNGELVSLLLDREGVTPQTG